MRTHFLHPVHRKKRLGRSHIRDFYVGEFHLKLIMCVLNVLKNDIGEIGEAIFHVSWCRKAMRAHILHSEH
jgi:hypothetical protein